MIVVDRLSNRPEFTSQSVDVAWSEWGADLSVEEYQRWLGLAEQDSRSDSAFSACFVALSEDRVVGVVSLHEFDIELMRDRSPWVCGMVVAPEWREQGIGRRLLDVLEDFARSKDIERVWVFTDSAADYYERCGWVFHSHVTNDGGLGTVLSKHLTTDPS